MPTPKNNKTKIIAGRNIYRDKNGQTVLYVPRKKTGYLILPKDQNGYLLYHNRWAVAIAVVMLLASFINDWKFPVLVGAALGIILELRYRFSYLPSLAIVNKFRPEKKLTLVEGLVEKSSKNKCLLLGILYLAFGILLVINEIQIQAPVYFIVGAVIVLAGCIYFATCYFIAFTRIK